jgi:hypothetical protein
MMGKALLVAIPLLFAILLILGRVGSAGLGPIELGILAALAIVWVAALVVHLRRRSARP